MRDIPITSEPNQELTVRLDDLRYVLRLKEAAGVMVCDVTVNDVPLILATRVLGGEPIIPYAHLLSDGGNFFLLTDSDELPDWRQFNATQSLVYISPAELAAL